MVIILGSGQMPRIHEQYHVFGLRRGYQRGFNGVLSYDGDAVGVASGG